MSQFRRLGRQFTLGVIDVLVVCLMFAFAVSYGINYFRPTNDCDRSWNDRCGVRIITDNKTGAQYLVTPQGGIIERKQNEH